MKVTRVSYVWDAKDWTTGIKAAKSIEELITFINKWSPFVWDAQEAASKTTWQEWASERDVAYRENGNPSESWMEKHGAIIIPENFFIAEQVADQFKAPLGTALIRLLEVRPDLLKGVK